MLATAVKREGVTQVRAETIPKSSLSSMFLFDY